MNSPNSLKLIMSARFSRHSRGPIASATALFEKLSPSIAGPILDMVVLSDDEVPVLASVFSPGEWLLITTARVAFSSDGQVTSVPNAEIKDVSVDAVACGNECQSETFQLEYISLETFSGTRRTIHVEPGGGYLGIMSLLKMVAERNWESRRGHR